MSAPATTFVPVLEADITAEIGRVRTLLDAGDVGGAGAALDALRRAWRRDATGFSPEHLVDLRGLAEVVAARRLGMIDEILLGTFGFDSFRPGQREIIAAVLAGRDCIGIMPTGAGKSSPTSWRRGCSVAPPSWCPR